jgi:hypothetical protein
VTPPVLFFFFFKEEGFISALDFRSVILSWWGGQSTGAPIIQLRIGKRQKQGFPGLSLLTN